MLFRSNAASPLRVEQQVAIIYCGTKNLFRDVPVNKVRETEKEYLNFMEAKHKDTLDQLKAGQISDAITEVLEKVAKEITSRYKA